MNWVELLTCIFLVINVTKCLDGYLCKKKIDVESSKWDFLHHIKKIVVEIKALGLLQVLILWLVVGKGILTMNICCLTSSLLWQSFFRKLLGLTVTIPVLVPVATYLGVFIVLLFYTIAYIYP